MRAARVILNRARAAYVSLDVHNTQTADISHERKRPNHSNQTNR